MLNKKRLAEYLATGAIVSTMDEDLASHDAKYHGGSFDPNSMTCSKRDKMAVGDRTDSIGGGHKSGKVKTFLDDYVPEEPQYDKTDIIKKQLPRDQYGKFLDFACAHDSRGVNEFVENVALILLSMDYCGVRLKPSTLRRYMVHENKYDSKRFSPDLEDFDITEAGDPGTEW